MEMYILKLPATPCVCPGGGGGVGHQGAVRAQVHQEVPQHLHHRLHTHTGDGPTMPTITYPTVPYHTITYHTLTAAEKYPPN